VPTTTPLADRVAAAGQQHLLDLADRLSPAQRDALFADLEAVEWDHIPAWIDRYIKSKPNLHVPSAVDPAPYYPSDCASPVRPYDASEYRARGEQLIRHGRVAAFIVAGGQGSRLGFEGPKGCFPAGAVTGKPLFHFFADSLLRFRDRLGVSVPLYIMTSPLNHDATVAFFKEHKHFGLDPADVTCFQQGAVPSFEMDSGRMMLAPDGRLATNPDGHGGSLTALARSGALEDMASRGIEHISYIQVDNPIARVLDPVFLGLHADAADSSAEMSSKMLPKAYAEEKLGMFVAADGRVSVIEYSDLPMDRQRETTPDGKLKFLAGNIAMHVLGRAFVERVAETVEEALPFHRAEKKIPHLDPETLEPVSPSANNGIKLERFVFDALPSATQSIVYETVRRDEFAPIKNAEGVDSPASSAQIQTERAAAWLERAGVKIPRTSDGKPDCVIELSTRTALWASDLADADLPKAIEPGAKVVI